MDYLFPDFINNEAEFGSSVSYWQSVCEAVLAEDDQLDDWQVWLAPSFTGDVEDDNLPVCSLVRKDLQKGVAINQQNPGMHAKWEWAAWTKEHTHEATVFWPRIYFVFTCNLTIENTVIFKKLFKQWIESSCDRKSLEDAIITLFGR